MFKRRDALEKYMYEPMEELSQIPQILESMKEDSDKLNYLVAFEKKRIDPINSIRDPKNYNGPGVIHSFAALQEFIKEIENIDKIFPEKYELTYRDYTIKIYPDRLKKVAQYTVDWCTEALRGLYFIHGRGAEDYLNEQRDVLDAARKTFHNF